MHCRNVHNARASNVFIPRSVCGEFAAGVVEAAVEGTVGAVSEDEIAAATGGICRRRRRCCAVVRWCGHCGCALCVTLWSRGWIQ